MLPSLLILSTTLVPIALCSLLSHEQEGTRHHAPRRERSFDRLGAPPFVPSTLLKPRVTLLPYLMGPEWIVDHHDFACMLPVGSAAAIMQDFYEDVAAYAATTLTSASRGCHICIGQLLLEIVAPPNVIVGWRIVQNFALHMLNLTKRRYTNTYQINFIHRPTGMMVTFNLYVGLLRPPPGGGL